MNTSLAKGSAGGQHWLARLIDHQETYGPHIVAHALQAIPNFTSILDIGAGSGRDLAIAASINPRAQRFAVECHPSSIVALQHGGVEVVNLDLEKESLPHDDCSLDVVMANQVLEHQGNFLD